VTVGLTVMSAVWTGVGIAVVAASCFSGEDPDKQPVIKMMKMSIPKKEIQHFLSGNCFTHDIHENIRRL
jgi:hypothetical protein